MEEAKQGRCGDEAAPIEPPNCPECLSNRIYKDGIRKNNDQRIQRYICRDCGYRFSDPAFSRRSHPVESYEQCNQSNSDPGASHRGAREVEEYNKSTESETYRLVCADEAKNLAATETIGNVVAGDINEEKSLLVQYSWYLKNRGNREQTIKSRTTLLKLLLKRGADLKNPESVKKTISEQKWVDKRKCNAVDSYTLLLRMQGKTWEPPRYKVTRQLPFIPKESELDALIAGSGIILATFLQILKETAARRGEAHIIRWSDIDFETNTIRLSPEKGSNPRIVKVSPSLIVMLQRLKAKRRTEDPDRVFQKKIGNTMESFYRIRKRIASKLGNPRITQIHPHTFRHWKATMLYHQTKDPLRVQRFLGHTTFQHTQLYIQLEESLSQDDYACKTATTAEEARQLIELGFEYVNEIQGIHLYRKRK